jgi:hypothetical protein
VTPSVSREVAAHVARRTAVRAAAHAPTRSRAPRTTAHGTSLPKRDEAEHYLACAESAVRYAVCAVCALHAWCVQLGAMLLVGLFEAAPKIKAACLEQLKKSPVTRFSDDGALEQLVAIDCAYLGAIALLNFAFPFILVPVAFNPAQLLVLPSADAPPTPPTPEGKK